MNPDLERLIQLQQLDSSAEQARRQLAEEPVQQRALNDRLAAAREHVAAAKTKLADGQVVSHNWLPLGAYLSSNARC